MNENENKPVLQQLIPVNEVKVEEIVVPQKQVDRSKKSKLPLILIIVILLLAGCVASYFVFIHNNEEPELIEECDPEVELCEEDEEVQKREYWDPLNSLITEVNAEEAVRLVCRKENTSAGKRFSSIFTVIFLEGRMVQLIVEDMTEFSIETMRYYNFYEGAAREEFGELDGNFQNFIYELRLRQNGISIATSIDMAADQDDVRNMFEFSWSTASITVNHNYDQVRSILSSDGYSC